MTDLMQLPAHVRQAADLAKRHPKRGHAAQPGTGPAGQTCRSCRNFRANTSQCWITASAGSTKGVLGADPACNGWVAQP